MIEDLAKFRKEENTEQFYTTLFSPLTEGNQPPNNRLSLKEPLGSVPRESLFGSSRNLQSPTKTVPAPSRSFK